jgi:outer membrane protein assembly factor BamB
VAAGRTPISCGFVGFALGLFLGVSPDAVAAAQGRNKHLPPEPTPILPAEPDWTVPLDAPPSAAVVMDAQRVYVPVQGGGVRALARSNGDLVWAEAADTRWPPLVSHGRVFIVLPNGLRAMDASTGNTLWNHPLEDAASAHPRAHGDLLIVPTEGAELLALNVADGAVAWRRPLGARTLHPAASLDSALHVTTSDGRVIAMEAATGTVTWERSLPGSLSAPATARDRVFVGSTNNFFYALDADNGRDAWRWRTGGDVLGAAAAHDRVYFVALDNLLRAVNRDNGNQQWKADIPTRPAGPPIVVGDVVMLMGVSPRLDAFVGKTGEVLGTYTAPLESQFEGIPAIDPDLKPFQVSIVTVVRDGTVTALRPTRMMLPDPPLVPFLELPGRELPADRLPRDPPADTITSRRSSSPCQVATRQVRDHAVS